MADEQKPGLGDPIEVTDADVDEALDICDGDPRATIRALLVEMEFTHRLLDIARREASWGYVRARPSRKSGGKAT